ncbi:MAG: HAD-IC family P-type ATPase [Chloroflexi bacterium]|nr:HAD-IC family P-type ATPase [Chloroflexota bacterium]
MPDVAVRTGLTEAEVARRRQNGQGNNVRLETSRSYLQILRENVFTFINMVLFGIGLVLVALGLYTDALMSVGIAMLNVVIGIIQEMKAKHTLDKIALLTRPKATVIRDGQEKVVDPTEVVLGDILVARPGDQIVVDGVVIGDGKMDVDESLLTGESDLIPKQAGDEVYSGTFCVNGSARYEATKVGLDSVANKLTSGARAFRQIKTPLQRDVDLIIRLLVLISVQMGILFGMANLVANLPATESARIAAVVTGLIPNGLFFMISIAYAMGAVRMAGSGALIQQSNAVESMSNVNVLCLDKTGTLTANRIHFFEVDPLTTDEAELRRILGIFAASVTATNRTSEALSEGCPGEKCAVVDEIPFSSARKWSALSFDGDDLRGVYVLGAPEMLHPHLKPGADLGSKLHEWADKGLRVLLFVHHPDVSSLHDSLGQPQLPPDLIPLGVISFSDELRPEADKTLKGFAEAGIRLKIISGDNPHTVAALARQAGLTSDIRVISGPELEEMDEAQLAKAAEETTVFGRITPQQKEMLVDALRARGYYVAMIGDGVNDVLSLKKAHIGIAMQSGSQATRGVADIILMNDSFAALPPAFREGQRILNGMQDIMRLFLTRVLYQALIIIGAAVVGVGFPFTPVNTSLLSLLTVGIPTLALAAWARPAPPKTGLIRSVVHFVIPAGLTLALLGLTAYTFYYVSIFSSSVGVPSINTAQEAAQLEALRGMPVSEIVAQANEEALAVSRTILTALVTLGGLLLLPLVEPPTRFWEGGDDYSGDWRPTLLAIALGAAFIIVLFVPALRDFFELAALQPQDFVFIGAALLVWLFTVRFIWRSRLLQRFMHLE